MTMTASYMPEATDRVSMDWNPEWSRRARATPVYAAIRSLGRNGVADLVETPETPIWRFLGSDPEKPFSGDRPGARDTRGRRADRAICALCVCSGPDNASSVRTFLSD